MAMLSARFAILSASMSVENPIVEPIFWSAWNCWMSPEALVSMASANGCRVVLAAAAGG